jgi:hypothetical protein
LRNPAAVRIAMTLISLAPNIVKPLIGHFWNSGKSVEVETGVRSRVEKTLR